MKIALLGDIALFGKFGISELNSVNAIQAYFKEVSELLSSYDYVIANLETPFIDGQKPYQAKSVYIGSSPSNAAILKYLTISIVNRRVNQYIRYVLLLDIKKNNLVNYKIISNWINNIQRFIMAN